jgi:hypothetical protein
LHLHTLSWCLHLHTLLQGIQAAADNFVSALRLARRLLSDTQAALTLANCAAKLRLEMSLTPAGSQERDNQAAALQKLQQLTDATLDDLAAGLTSHFLPGATLSTDEVGGALAAAAAAHVA